MADSIWRSCFRGRRAGFIPGPARLVMTDTLDFVKNLWGSMQIPGTGLPGMPGMLLAQKGLVTNDETRFGIETLGAEQYERLTYYEKWIASVTHALVARGLITTDELGRKMADVATWPAE